jgi:methylated-DNA-[protein]-cysteine S-methyltransferase
MRARFPEAREAAPPREVRGVIDGIITLLRGERTDLSRVTLDMRPVSPFHRKVYDVAREIPAGATMSYGQLATRLGSPGAARAVGQALGRNPFAIIVPCHRVLAAGGKPGGFSANGGANTKLRILSIEASTPATNDVPQDLTFGFDPLHALEHLRSADAQLARLMDRVGPFRMRLKRTPSAFFALAESIAYQQLTGKAAATIFRRLCALFPDAEGLTPERLLSASDDQLRGAGLSRTKILALKDLAKKAAQGDIPTFSEMSALGNDRIIDRVTTVRGVGRWTVEMLLMFRLGRPDVLPLDDYGIRRGFAIAFKKRELPGREELAKRGARWIPYRTVASWYLWRAVEFSKKK